MSSEIDDETLVAFLDGELSQEEANQVASKLEANEQLRDRASALEQTWALVSDLPQVKPNASLAQSTLELVTLELESENQEAQQRKRLNWLLLGCGVCLIYAVGAVLGSSISARFQDKMLANLDVLAEYDSLRNIDSEAWVAELQKIDGLTEAFPGTKLGDSDVPQRFEERKKWLDDRTTTELGRLRDNVQLFLDEPEERREQLKDFYDSAIQQVSSDRDASALDAIRSYDRLLKARSSSQALRIKAIEDLSARAEQVRRLVQSKLVTNYASTMSEEDRQAIDEWVGKIRLYSPWLQMNEIEFLDEMDIRDEDLEGLETTLSNRAQGYLENLGSDVKRQRLAFFFWVNSVMDPSSSESVTAQELLETLESLTEDVSSSSAEQIQMLPEDEARSELRKLMGVSDSEAF